jgi:hypothetical protein
MYEPRWRSGAHRIFLPWSCRYLTMSRPIDEVTIQSARAFTAADCVGVDDHRAVRMLVAERGELVGRAAQVQRAGRVQVRHQDGLFRAEDLGRLAHEAHAGDDQRLRGVVAAEARHFQRVRHAAAGFLGQVLQVGIDVVVGDQHGFTLLQQAADAVLQRGLLGDFERDGVRAQASAVEQTPPTGRSYSKTLIGAIVFIGNMIEKGGQACRGGPMAPIVQAA